MMHCIGQLCKFHGTEPVVSGSVVLNGPLKAPFCTLTVHKYCKRSVANYLCQFCPMKHQPNVHAFVCLLFVFLCNIMRGNSAKCKCKVIDLGQFIGLSVAVRVIMSDKYSLLLFVASCFL